MKSNTNLDDTLAGILQSFPANASNLQRDFLRADLELQADYAGQWVVYVDRIETSEKEPRLTRQVLFARPSWREARQTLRGHPDEARARIEYVDDPMQEPEPLLSHLGE